MNENIEKSYREIKDRASIREKLLENIVKNSKPIKNFPDQRNFLVLAREWNSWYPSMLNVRGGCYFFNVNNEIIIIDPGFNTLEVIKKKELDIRLIRHIFITHFHPDHTENLVALITRLSSKKNKLTIYLNSTSYQQFKIYSRGYTEFIEIKPNMRITLRFDNKDPTLEVYVDILTAYHKEVSGAFNSVSLKFFLKEKSNIIHKIGFMSDSDGSENYIGNYVKNFKDCDILIPHLGAIHQEKVPTGYKHLYESGLDLLLKNLPKKGPLIILGEFGFELASEKDFKPVVHDLFPRNRLTYSNFISTFLNFFSESANAQNYPYIARELTSLFGLFINDVKFLTPNLEIFFPFITFNKTFIHESKSIFLYKDAFEYLKREVNDFRTSFQPEQFLNLWKIFHKTVIFLAETSQYCINLFEQTFNDWNLNKIFEVFKKIVKNFVNFIPVDLKNSILNSYFILGRKYPVENSIDVDDFLNLINVNINPTSLFFQGLDSEIANFFNSNEMKGLIFIFFGYFILRLFKTTSYKTPITIEQDGREIICKYFSRKYNKKVIPVHPSYVLYFEDNQIKIEGFTSNPDCLHLIKKKLLDIDENWSLISKNEDKEILSIFPFNGCEICNQIRKERDAINELEISKHQEQFERDLQEPIKDLEDANKRLGKVNNFYGIFFHLDFIYEYSQNNLIRGIDNIKLLQKIIDLDKDNSENEIDFLKLKILIHPAFFCFQNTKDYILEKIQRSNIDLKEIFLQSLSDKFPYRFVPNEEVIPAYYELFDDLDLMSLIEEKSSNLTIEDILSIINFFFEKKERDKNFFQRRSFIYFTKQFVNAFYPLIKEPEKHQEKYQTIEKNKDKIERLGYLGYPFNNYKIRLLYNHSRFYNKEF
jgi:hypothetical protein